MSDQTDEFDVIRGSGEIFVDLGHPDADVRRLKADLAAEIVRTLEARGLSVRKAEEMFGVPASDFSRIRNARLQRFTVDRLMTILSKLDRKIEVTVTARDMSTATSLPHP